MINNELILTQL